MINNNIYNLSKTIDNSSGMSFISVMLDTFLGLVYSVQHEKLRILFENLKDVNQLVNSHTVNITIAINCLRKYDNMILSIVYAAEHADLSLR